MVIPPISTSALTALPAANSSQLSATAQLARAVMLTDALQAAADETLRKAVGPHGQDNATIVALQMESAALGVWTALTSELIRSDRDRRADVLRNVPVPQK